MVILNREEAITKLRELVGKDLRPLSSKFGVTIFTDEINHKGRNKGWGGQVLER